jgi:hypothetical protein
MRRVIWLAGKLSCRGVHLMPMAVDALLRRAGIE